MGGIEVEPSMAHHQHLEAWQPFHFPSSSRAELGSGLSPSVLLSVHVHSHTGSWPLTPAAGRPFPPGLFRMASGSKFLHPPLLHLHYDP